LTVNANVVDEIDFNKMPETGGNPITGPSKDQFTIVGETAAIPEIVVVAGPSADPQVTEKLKDFLLNKAKDDKMLCEQLNVQGFAPADRAIYDASRSVLSPT
jgi:ABC-type phosphate/phosphonate transport system substrate-binding protein